MTFWQLEVYEFRTLLVEQLTVKVPSGVSDGYTDVPACYRKRTDMENIGACNLALVESLQPLLVR